MTFNRAYFHDLKNLRVFRDHVLASRLLQPDPAERL